MQRCEEKAELLREFNDEVKRFTKIAAYVVGSGPDSNKRLEQTLELRRQAGKLNALAYARYPFYFPVFGWGSGGKLRLKKAYMSLIKFLK